MRNAVIFDQALVFLMMHEREPKTAIDAMDGTHKRHRFHMPKTRTRNVPGMNAPRGPVGDVGPRSDKGRNIRFVFRSSAIFRAPGAVATVSSNRYLSGESCWTMETVPSPLEMYMR